MKAMEIFKLETDMGNSCNGVYLLKISFINHTNNWRKSIEQKEKKKRNVE